MSGQVPENSLDSLESMGTTLANKLKITAPSKGTEIQISKGNLIPANIRALDF